MDALNNPKKPNENNLHMNALIQRDQKSLLNIAKKRSYPLILQDLTSF